MLLKKLIRAIKNPRLFILKAAAMGRLNWMDDATYLKLMYRLKMGKKLNLDNPQTFNEKLQWLKLHDRKDIYTTMVDKYAAKKYVADIIGEEYIIPTLGIWNSFNEVDFDKLPEQFVLKCTHDSGGLVIVRDKSKLDKAAAKKKLEASLERNYYWSGREWPYKNVPPRILAEKYMEENDIKNIEGLTDYKFYCFNGEAKFLYVAKANFVNGEKHDLLQFYTLDWRKAPFQRHDHSPLPYEVKKPVNFDEMFRLSEILAQNIPFFRVDWYEINGQSYFGELTFLPGSGYGEFYPDEWNYTFGSWIDLGKSLDRRK